MGIIKKSRFYQSPAALYVPPPVVGGGTPTTWNPLDHATNINLTGSNKTSTLGTTGYAFVRSKGATTTGQKVYVEFLMTVTYSSSSGFITSVPTNYGASFPGAVTSPSEGFFYAPTGGFVCLDSLDHSDGWTTYTSGDVISIAFDTALGRSWVRKNGGSWYPAGGDPAAGTGGHRIPFAGPYYACHHGGDTGDAATCKFDPADWTYGGTKPTGFTGLVE